MHTENYETLLYIQYNPYQSPSYLFRINKFWKMVLRSVNGENIVFSTNDVGTRYTHAKKNLNSTSLHTQKLIEMDQRSELRR